MAFSELAFSLGVFCLLSLAHGQLNVDNVALPGCSDQDGQSGKYLKSHPTHCELYLQCDNGRTRSVRKCPSGLLFDEDLQVCNWPNRVICKSWPCVSGQSTRYPGTCNGDYYQCNGSGYDKMSCIQGQYYQAGPGVCTGLLVPDHTECIRYGTVATRDPRINCTLVIDPSSPCNYRTRTNGIDSVPYSCAEGTQFSADNCTCITSNACMRANNNSFNKIPDPQCRASFKVDFREIRDNVPQVFTEKPNGIDSRIADYILSSGAEFTGNQATLSSANTNGVQPFMYAYSFSNNQLGMFVIISIVLRSSTAQLNQRFEVLSNSYEAACVPTIDISATYNGGTYAVNLYALGANVNSGAGQGTISANLTASISAASTDFVEVRVLYDGHATLQLKNRGLNGDNQNGQLVSSPASGYLGARLAYNQCGFRIARGLNGNVRSIIVRESCTNLSLFSN
jgi:hypothetical protein